MTPHPKGSGARVLLTSVFGPYAQDDEFGSRTINPMELYHNQVTREQGPFSLRMFHRSWGILMIQENISAPTHGARLPHARGVRARAAGARVRHRRHLVDHRQRRQGARDVPDGAARSRRSRTIVVGGHVAAIPGIEHMVDADHIVQGDGIAWMREFLGEDADARRSGIRRSSRASTLRVLGREAAAAEGAHAPATIIPSVGCPMGCNFCTTSAFFGGKGKYPQLLRHRRGAVRRHVARWRRRSA